MAQQLSEGVVTPTLSWIPAARREPLTSPRPEGSLLELLRWLTVETRHAVALELTRPLDMQHQVSPVHQRTSFTGEVRSQLHNTRIYLQHQAAACDLPDADLLAVTDLLEAAIEALIAFDAGLWIPAAEADDPRLATPDARLIYAYQLREERLAPVDRQYADALRALDRFGIGWEARTRKLKESSGPPDPSDPPEPNKRLAGPARPELTSWVDRCGGQLRCSIDCGTIQFRDKELYLSNGQKWAVSYLLTAWEDERYVFTDSEIIDAASSSASRLKDIFTGDTGGKDLWGTLIVPYPELKGRYTLALKKGSPKK